MLIDLKGLEIGELKKLDKALTRAISTYHARRARGLLDEIKQVSISHGFSLAQVQDIIKDSENQIENKKPKEKRLENKKPKKSRSEYQVKYRNPLNLDQVWSGRGREPAWFTESLADGRSLADLRVNI